MELQDVAVSPDGETVYVTGSLKWADGMDATDDDAVIREPLIATHRSRLGFTLNGGVTTFEGEPVDLEEEGFIAHVFAR